MAKQRKPNASRKPPVPSDIQAENRRWLSAVWTVLGSGINKKVSVGVA
jgi:hypothetical protein